MITIWIIQEGLTNLAKVKITSITQQKSTVLWNQLWILYLKTYEQECIDNIGNTAIN